MGLQGPLGPSPDQIVIRSVFCLLLLFGGDRQCESSGLSGRVDPCTSQGGMLPKVGQASNISLAILPRRPELSDLLAVPLLSLRANFEVGSL